ncbi:MAG: hypothetical protein EX270_12760 [Pseudomonadales bacterium]|nr:MAG: hypothetical protein EX270_12760 [Pseudomonadales bacterium]
MRKMNEMAQNYDFFGPMGLMPIRWQQRWMEDISRRDRRRQRALAVAQLRHWLKHIPRRDTL